MPHSPKRRAALRLVWAYSAFVLLTLIGEGTDPITSVLWSWWLLFFVSCHPAWSFRRSAISHRRATNINGSPTDAPDGPCSCAHRQRRTTPSLEIKLQNAYRVFRGRSQQTTDHGQSARGEHMLPLYFFVRLWCQSGWKSLLDFWTGVIVDGDRLEMMRLGTCA